MDAEVKNKCKAVPVSINNDMKVNGRNEGKDPPHTMALVESQSVSHFRHIKAFYTQSYHGDAQ